MKINEMLKELKVNGLVEISAGVDCWEESYKGCRHNTIEITDNVNKFSEDNSMMLAITEDGINNEENIKFAYKHMLLQKFALPNVI